MQDQLSLDWLGSPKEVVNALGWIRQGGRICIASQETTELSELVTRALVTTQHA